MPSGNTTGGLYDGQREYHSPTEGDDDQRCGDCGGVRPEFRSAFVAMMRGKYPAEVVRLMADIIVCDCTPEEE